MVAKSAASEVVFFQNPRRNMAKYRVIQNPCILDILKALFASPMSALPNPM
jgi:hypothetical protein